MYAVVETGGKQYRIESGNIFKVDLVDVDPGKEFVIDRILLIGDGDDVRIGNPCVAQAQVSTTVMRHGRHKKVIVFKKKPKKGTKKKQGHRQYFTELKVNEIKIAQ